ncbi:hypothetical protein EW026_g1165 [Hermanssonia centrifuga]|uniref:Uncharacterized protein n=1 Tax=Hermanssonia centrifuga TaxID=98765 RepID=A0A4S4KSH2_9APHY|nr:hypothetical protein EW026_g1165 [Hermanssonia centrifuga]
MVAVPDYTVLRAFAQTGMNLASNGIDFLEVMKAFLVVLARIGPALWKDEGDEFPLVVFNTIKDNAKFSDHLLSLQPGQSHWSITWMETFIKSLGDMQAFHSVFPLMIRYLCEELQHERFKDIRPDAFLVASKLFYDILFGTLSKPAEESYDFTAVWESFNIHTNTIVSVGFGKTYNTQPWTEARSLTRQLIRSALKRDIKNVYYIITALAGVQGRNSSLVAPVIRERLWQKTYETVLPGDSDALAFLFDIISPIAHIDDLLEAAYADIMQKLPNPSDAPKVLRAANHALAIFRNGFADAVSRQLDFSDSSTMLDVLRRPNVVKHIMAMMFSPVENVREPAQGVAGLALDVESRPDCLRELLSKFPETAFDGMLGFLDTFTKYASKVPEACSVSKALARCFTDIIDVLCSTPDGLLHNTSFLKSIPEPGPAVILPRWWGSMAKALTVIFQRTPRWALFFENEVMITWMRDALIFGRDMLAQRKVIESGALALSPQSSTNRGVSRIGKKMVDELQQVLLELTRWLRLTDEELLHQAFALLQSLLACFQETKITPSANVLQKLQKQIDDARKKDAGRPQTRLDSARVSRLQDTISPFMDADDEIQIISHTVREQRQEIRPTIKSSSKSNNVSTVSQRTSTPISLRPGLPQRVSTKSSISNYFTLEDQRKLASASSMPKFTKPARPITLPHKDDLTLPSVTGSSSEAASVVNSSSSSEDSDSEDGGDTLASLAKMQKTPAIKKPAERRQVKMLDMPSNARNPALERLNKREEARRTGLRLKPDISSLHRVLLSWDHNHKGNEPPGGKLSLLRVPDTFSDPQHYRRVFEPLLLMECWAQIQQSKEEIQEKYECLIVGRQYIDDWVDFDILITEVIKKDWSLSETDVVLLKHPDGRKSHLGKVQHCRGTPMGIQATVRTMIPSSEPGPQTNTTWVLSKTFSLTTLHREYAALMGLPYYDLCGVILQAGLMKPSIADMREVKQTMSTYQLNEPQAKAVISSLRTDGFSLIQGVKDVSLDHLVEQKVNSNPDSKNSAKDAGSEISLLRSQLESVKRVRQEKLDEMSTIHDNTAKTFALEEEVRKLNKQRANLTHQLDKLRDKQKSDFRALDAIGRRFRAEVLQEADVICSTLAGAGHDLLESFDFEMVIIDEAAQAIELSSLIPLKYRCSRCVMVGDPQQLPPTVLSSEVSCPISFFDNDTHLPCTKASNYGYNQSLFVRLQKHRPDAVHLLSIQYRMHPQISQLPSRIFYDGRLLDGPNMDVKTAKPWHSHPKFGEYKFYNVSRGVEENGPYRSLINKTESQVAVALFNRLRQEFSTYDFDLKVGVVTMYRAQVTELRRAFERRFGSNISGVVDFNTVDGFQGQEKDIIILSCVRAGPGLQKIGFLSDVRRMNVALTRAKSSVFVLGNAATLERSETKWKNIVVDARERSRLVDQADVTYFTSVGDAGVKPVSRGAKATKPASKAPVLPPLSTPQQLAESSRRPSLSSMKTSLQDAHTEDLPNPSPAEPGEILSEGSRKTPAEDDGEPTKPAVVPRPPPPPQREEHSKPMPKSKPLVKRPKQGPNLFIPNKKRPAPQGGEAGPSANRRRV